MHTFSRFARPYQRLCAAFSTVPVGNQIAEYLLIDGIGWRSAYLHRLSILTFVERLGLRIPSVNMPGSRTTTPYADV